MFSNLGGTNFFFFDKWVELIVFRKMLICSQHIFLENLKLKLKDIYLKSCSLSQTYFSCKIFIFEFFNLCF